MKQSQNQEPLPYSGKISFNSIDKTPGKINKPTKRRWLKEVIKNERLVLGEISFGFCTDDYLLEINKTYLNHDYYTDIITFNLNEEHIVGGDIYISVDRVWDNAKLLKTSYENELNRVLVHGILHLCGWDDKTKRQKAEMRKREDYYLSLLG